MSELIVEYISNLIGEPCELFLYSIRLVPVILVLVLNVLLPINNLVSVIVVSYHNIKMNFAQIL